MTKKRTQPRFPVVAASLRERTSFDIPSLAWARWNAAIVAKEGDSGSEDNVITVYDPIGFDPWTGGGVTAKRIAAALRSIGEKDVVVNINSPGGDLFEGIAIYNILRDHPGKVTTRVIGLAASAASLIAMAGDQIEVARASFMMIHNVWVMAIGNRNDLRDAADMLEPFDTALADVYAARTGKDKKKIAKMMDDETWFAGSQAIEEGFADAYLPADQVEESKDASARSRRLHWREFRKVGPALVSTLPGIERRTFTMDAMKVERRGVGDAETRVMSGHAAVFNQWSADLGGFRERIAPGAFASALAQDVRALFNHDENLVLGRTVSKTLRLSEDDLGLRFEVDLPDTSVARDLATLVERGDVDRVSFAFNVPKKGGDEWKKGENGVWERTILRVETLWDVSPVTYAAYPQTDVAVRAMSEARSAAEPEPAAPAPAASQEAADAEAAARKRAEKELAESIEIQRTRAHLAEVDD